MLVSDAAIIGDEEGTHECQIKIFHRFLMLETGGTDSIIQNG